MSGSGCRSWRSHVRCIAAFVISALVGFAGACASPRQQAGPQTPRIADQAAAIRIERSQNARIPPYRFIAEDEKFLDDVQRGAFNFLWASCDPANGIKTGMVADRTSKSTVSVAGVGFQLSGICVGVERGWVTREQGRARAELILRSLRDNPENRRFGLFYHFVDQQTAGQPTEAYEHVVSTIDSALLFAGMLTASAYFGGEVKTLADGLFTDANWSQFVCQPGIKDPKIVGYISLGWKPDDKAQPLGPGALLPFGWLDNGDEHRLVTFLAAAAPKDAHRVDPALYYRLRRQLGSFARPDHDGVVRDTGTMVWFPWSGALFTSFFAHCWIDYAGLGMDDPASLGVPRRARVDWWENSRRHVLLHQLKALEAREQKPSTHGIFGEHAWGLNASDVASGYAVPGVFPNLIAMPGSTPEVDYTEFKVKDDFGDGTLAPYSVGCSILFDPARSIAAMRHYRAWSAANQPRPIWTDPTTGGFGFQDAFNASTGWVAPDHVAIDQGPLLLAIENARTGLLWRLFHAHPFVKDAQKRLNLDFQHTHIRVPK